MHGVLELLSAFVDDHGGVSLPAFLGCMRALFEASAIDVVGTTIRYAKHTTSVWGIRFLTDLCRWLSDMSRSTDEAS